MHSPCLLDFLFSNKTLMMMMMSGMCGPPKGPAVAPGRVVSIVLCQLRWGGCRHRSEALGAARLFYGCSHMHHLSGNNRRNSHFMGS